MWQRRPSWMRDLNDLDQIAREERDLGWDLLVGGMPLAPVQRVPWLDGLAWLVQTGLVQQWTVHGPGRGGDAVPHHPARGRGDPA